jgi:addiction module HigA family antidote
MMTNPMTAGLAPTHPGELLREDVLPAVKESKAAIAKMLGISRQHLYDLLNERKPVTSRMALRLAKLFGGAPEMWLRMQMNYDLRVEAEEMAEELSRIPLLAA